VFSRSLHSRYRNASLLVWIVFAASGFDWQYFGIGCQLGT
jgi:hypothetical protein